MKTLLPPWEIIATRQEGTKLIVTARSGARTSTVEFLNEHQLSYFDWEEDFQFALRKAVSNPRKGFRNAATP